MSEKICGYKCLLANGHYILLTEKEEVLELYGYKKTQVSDALLMYRVPEEVGIDMELITREEGINRLKKLKHIEEVEHKVLSYFKAEPFKYSKPPILMTATMLKFIMGEIDPEDMPIISFDKKGIGSANDEADMESSFLYVLGAFVDAESVLDPSGYNCTIAFSDGTCYSPVGQHATFHSAWLRDHRVYLISIEDYKRACSSYTPESYIKALEGRDTYELARQYVIDDEAFPSHNRIPEVISVS